MFGYYTTLLIVTSSIILSAVMVIYFDDILGRFNKTLFLLAYIMLLIIYNFEWLAVYLERVNSDLHFITTFSMGVVLFLGPSITALLALGMNDKKSKKLNYLVIFILALSFILGFSGFFSDAIFYYDEQNVYHRGEYYFIHLILVILSALTLFINTLRFGIRYQNKNISLLLLDFVIFTGALLVQFLFEGIWILWISYLIAIGFAYIYYATSVSQIDILTRILNRKCFDSQLYSIKSKAIILFFDVNKFKAINDTYGHAAGDYCLVEIAKAIKEVYGKSGYCYRIGGDEFSVILNKNLDSIDELNAKFHKIISEKNYTLDLPTVSIGHSYFYPNETSIQTVIEEADAMMYKLKEESSLKE